MFSLSLFFFSFSFFPLFVARQSQQTKEVKLSTGLQHVAQKPDVSSASHTLQRAHARIGPYVKKMYRDD